MNRKIIIFATLLWTVAAFAQQEKTREQMGGVYYAYPSPQAVTQERLPKGMRLFTFSITVVMVLDGYPPTAVTSG